MNEEQVPKDASPAPVPPTSIEIWWKDVTAQFWHTARIVTTIVFHGGLFVLWLLADWGFGHAAEYLKTEGLHENVVFAFRWVASVAVFCVAAKGLMGDIAEFIGTTRKKFYESWGLLCRTCPARQGQTT